MPHTRIVISLAIALGVLALAPAASAHHGCSKHAKGAQIINKTKEAHVFIKRQRWYGCAAKYGRVRLLPGLDTTEAIRFGDGDIPVQIRLAGRMVAWEQYTLYPAGAESQTNVWAYDLGTGKTLYTVSSGLERPSGEDSVMEELVLKRNGSAAWVARIRCCEEVTYEVNRFSMEKGAFGRVVLEFSKDIDPKSLALSADRQTVTWTTGGQPRSGPLP